MEELVKEISINSDLDKNNHFVIDQFIATDVADALSLAIRNHHRAQPMPSDGQVIGSPAFSELDFLKEAHRSILQKTEQYVGAALVPTYVYGRIYQHGAVLAPHRDRDACEVSITLNLSSDCDWGIWFEKQAGEQREVILRPGSAAIYLGCDTLHWRDAFEGTECIQVFFHFVLKGGERDRPE